MFAAPSNHSLPPPPTPAATWALATARKLHATNWGCQLTCLSAIKHCASYTRTFPVCENEINGEGERELCCTASCQPTTWPWRGHEQTRRAHKIRYARWSMGTRRGHSYAHSYSCSHLVPALVHLVEYPESLERDSQAGRQRTLLYRDIKPTRSWQK